MALHSITEFQEPKAIRNPGAPGMQGYQESRGVRSAMVYRIQGYKEFKDKRSTSQILGAPGNQVIDRTKDSVAD